MSDFAQAGLIATLQRLNEQHVPAVVRAVEDLSQERPIALVLPCHGGDLESPALAHIVEELMGARFVGEIVLSLNGVDVDGVERAKERFATLPQRVRILWNDGSAMRAALGDLAVWQGKGLNVWTAVGLLTAEGNAAVIATQDCDVASFRSEALARLCFPCLHPECGYDLAKMYYSRVTDRLYGRVSRLFFAPLLRAITRVAGHQPLLDFLQSFRYPLAGEIVFRRELAAKLPFHASWGLEVASLCEAFRVVDPRGMCQVDGGTGYDHRHQAAGPGSGLNAMCREIAATLYAQLETEGLVIDHAFRESVELNYRREAAHALKRSADLARINGLPFDSQGESEIVAAFADDLRRTPDPSSAQILPAWTTARSDAALLAGLRSAAIEVG